MNHQLFPPDFLRLLAVQPHVSAIAAPSLRSGCNRGRESGDSMDFRDFRPYQTGDDPRDVDWNVFQRSHKLVIRRYQQEPMADHRIVLDHSNSIWYKEERRVTVWRLAALLGSRLLAGGDRVRLEGASRAASGVISPHPGAIWQWCELLSCAYFAASPTCRLAIPHARGRGRCWVISDFYAADSLTELAARLERAAFHPLRIMEPGEENPAAWRMHSLVDAENGSRCPGCGSLAAYRARFTAFEALLCEVAARAGGRLARFTATSEIEALYRNFQQELREGN